MADCSTQVHMTYFLKLTDDEALWLKDYLQNPLRQDTPEIGQHKRLREAIFTALHSPVNPPSAAPR